MLSINSLVAWGVGYIKGVIGKVHFVLLTSEHSIVSKSSAHKEILATTGGPASTPLKQLAESLASITKLETAGFSGENDFLYFLVLSSSTFQEQLFKWPDSIKIQLKIYWECQEAFISKYKCYGIICKLRRDRIFLRGISKYVMLCGGL